MTPTPRPAAVLARLRAADGPADADLLGRFARDRDEGAFELLVWRHAGMVLAACRAVLRDHHAAEDACQATFLALARRAHAVGGRGTVAGWLYRVARRTAARAARRRPGPPVARLDGLPAPAAVTGPDPDAVAALHAELDRLPEEYRAPVLLCFLGGLTYADAARRLGWPIGTVAGRLARAKDRLRRRLTGRGVCVPAAGVAALAESVPVVSPAFAAATARAGAAFAAGGVPGVSDPVLELARGAVRAMTTTKLQWAAGVLVAWAAVAAGVVWAGGQPPAPDAPAARPPAAAGPAAGAQPPPAERPATAAQRQLSFNHLKQIMLAVHQYEAVHGRLPADVRDPAGRPLLSWRVLLLPYLEQDGLYRQFRQNEPWDSEHNLKLLAQLPPVYRVGFEPEGSTHTYYQAFAGPGTPFGPPPHPVPPAGPGDPAAGPLPPARALPLARGAGGPANPPGVRLADIQDGTSNTLGVVEAGPPVPWTKPADFAYNPKGPLPKPAGPFSTGLHAATLDGAAFALRRDLADADLRQLIEMADGQPVAGLTRYLAPALVPTAKDRAAARDQIAANRAKVAEAERLMREQIELLGGVVGDITDPTEAQQLATGLDRLVEELRTRNTQLRSRKDGPTPPARPPGK